MRALQGHCWMCSQGRATRGAAWPLGRASVPPARRNVSNPVSSESEWHGVGRPRAESARIDDLEGSCFRSESGESFELSVQRGCVLECRSSFNFHRLIAAAPRAPLVCHSTHTRSNLPARSPTATRPRHTGYTYPRATLDRIAIAHWLGLAPSVTHATGRISRHVRTVSRLRRMCAVPAHADSPPTPTPIPKIRSCMHVPVSPATNKNPPDAKCAPPAPPHPSKPPTTLATTLAPPVNALAPARALRPAHCQSAASLPPLPAAHLRRSPHVAALTV